MRLDAVEQLAWLAVGWDEVEPATRQHAVRGKAEDAPRQDVEAAKVIQQPAVHAELPDGGLDGGKVEHTNTSRVRRQMAESRRQSRTVGTAFCFLPSAFWLKEPHLDIRPLDMVQ